jgi:hypothetical protein
MRETTRPERIERIHQLVRHMNEVDRNLSAAYVRAKDAGTLILVDRSGRVPRVLLGKRHAGHAFMPTCFRAAGWTVPMRACQWRVRSLPSSRRCS